MKILITGSNGFIGSHLQELLVSEGNDVVGLDNQRWYTRKMPNTIIGDIREKTLVENLVKSVDVVYHLAAQINVDYGNKCPDETININVKGTLNVLEACVKYKKKLIFASSSEVYGTAQTDLISEEHPLDAQSVYAATKIMGDRLSKAYYDTYGLDVSILRNFNTFGLHQRNDSYGGVIAKFVDRALHKKPPIIYGDGSQQRDYIWITDALEGYRIASETNLHGKPLNIASGECVTVDKIAQLVIGYTHKELKPIHVAPRPGEVQRLQGDISYARTLGFSPKTDFEKHLYEYIQFRKKELSTA